MASKKELQIAYGLAVYFLIVGILSYAVFPAQSSEVPVRKMFQVAAGKVLFDHKVHTSAEGYGISCQDCHHHPGGEELDTQGCKACHLGNESETLPQSCGDCHESDEIEGTEMVKSGDAFHNQCIGCHQEFEAGPDQCAQCHVM